MGRAAELGPKPGPSDTATAAMLMQSTAGTADIIQAMDAPAKGEAVAEPTLPAGACITLP